MQEIIKLYTNLGYKMNRYYDRIGKSCMIKIMYQYIEKSEKNTIKIIDIGGGWGYDLRVLSEYMKLKKNTKIVELYLIDKYLESSSDSIFHNTKKFDNITYFESDFTTFSSDTIGGKADIIFSAETIEHIWDIEKEVWFSKMNELLNMDGKLLISTPNGSSIIKNIGAIYNKNNKIFIGQDFDAGPSHHKGVPTIFECLSLFQRKGFIVSNIHAVTPLFELKKGIIGSIVQTLFYFVPFRYMFSTGIIYEGIKMRSNNMTMWYNSDLKSTLGI